MARPVGVPKTGGRKRGAPNKKTKEIEALFNELNYDPARELIKQLPSMKSSDRAYFHLKLMRYIYPERKAVELSGQLHQVTESFEDYIARKHKAKDNQ